MEKPEPRSPAERRRGYRCVLEARSQEATPERLRELARDQIGVVRLWVARNPRTPPDALAAMLTGDVHDFSMVWRVLSNPNVPDSALRWLAEWEANRAAAGIVGLGFFRWRQVIVHHRNTSTTLAAELIANGACACPGACGRGYFDKPVDTDLDSGKASERPQG